jgi:hypothetical protein
MIPVEDLSVLHELFKQGEILDIVFAQFKGVFGFL